MTSIDIANADHQMLAQLLPHGIGMALFEEVIRCDAEAITVLSRRHQRDDYPFAIAGQIDSAMLVEYGAQAAGLHAAITGDARSADGRSVIGVVRNLVLHEPRFAQTGAELVVESRLQFGSASGAMYSFTARCGQVLLADGQLGLLRTG